MLLRKHIVGLIKPHIHRVRRGRLGLVWECCGGDLRSPFIYSNGFGMTPVAAYSQWEDACRS